MNKELRKMNDEQMAMVAGGLGPFRKTRKQMADAIKRQQEETKARLQKEEEERWRQEQARLNAETSVDFDTEGLMPAIFPK